MNDKRFLGMKPTHFRSLGYVGSTGSDWRIIDYSISKLVSQNILYAAYHNPKTINEISDMVGAEISLIEDQIHFFEKHGFMDKISHDLYITNMLLHDFSKEVCEEKHKIYNQYAMMICDKYIQLLLQWIVDGGKGIGGIVPVRNLHEGTASSYMDTFMLSTSISSCDLAERMNAFPTDRGIYVPENDLNFLLWTMISFALNHKLFDVKQQDIIPDFCIKRYDGSEFNVFATVEKNMDLSYKRDLYQYSGPYTFGFDKKAYPFSVWIYNTYYDDRDIDWVQVLQKKFVYLYFYMTGKIDKTMANSFPFDSMLKHGLLCEKQPLSPNVIISKMTYEDIKNDLPNIPEELLGLNDEFAEKIYNLCKAEYPEHMIDLAHVFYQNHLASGEVITRVFEILLKNNVLKPLTDAQKMTVNMIMFLDECVYTRAAV